MKNIALILAVGTLLSACGSTPTYQPSYQPSYTPTVAQAETEPADADSGFSSEEEDRKADEAITSAQRTYASVQSTTSAFSLGTAKCDDRSMSDTLSSLQAVDQTAQRYMQMATTAAEPADREAAMDVLDELNTVILDGLLDVTKAYRSHKCFPYAKSIITQAKAIYGGPAYSNWVSALDTEMVAIDAEQVTSAPSPTKTPGNRAGKKKSVAKKAVSS